jgi:peptide/nickel transport system substrate-binding protein
VVRVPNDPEIEQMRDAWMEAPIDQQKAIADRIQVRAFETVPFIPLGYYWQPSAWNKSVAGTFSCPITSFWNISKA